jgi:predicted dehydrogenase
VGARETVFRFEVADMVTVAVVGVGGWGKNLARNYYEMPDARLKYICDLDQKKLAALSKQLTGTATTTDFSAVLADDEVQAVVIGTSAPTHYRLCKQALEKGKDVYVEKPFVLEVGQAQELIDMANDLDRVLMVGHLLEYHPVVTRLHDMIRKGELGDVQYIYTQRLNLGTVREDENALWNFAPHDISSILYLLGKEPVNVAARGQSYLRRGIEDVVFLSMYFADKTMAHVHVSWLDPHKVRKMTIVGKNKMAVFDDLEASDKLMIYDKGASYSENYDTFAEYIGLRFGDITIPYIKVGEPLRHECSHFLECVRERKTPRSDGHDGLRVVKILAAAERSMKASGEPVDVG